MTHDTQLFFPGDVEDQVFQSEPYKSRGPNTVALDRDLVLRGDRDRCRRLPSRSRRRPTGSKAR